MSPRTGQRITINDTLKLNAEQIWINDQARDDAGQRVFGNRDGIPSRNRKVRYFEGWVWIKHAGPQASADDKKTSFTRKLQLHSEGARAGDVRGRHGKPLRPGAGATDLPEHTPPHPQVRAA